MVAFFPNCLTVKRKFFSLIKRINGKIYFFLHRLNCSWFLISINKAIFIRKLGFLQKYINMFVNIFHLINFFINSCMDSFFNITLRQNWTNLKKTFVTTRKQKKNRKKHFPVQNHVLYFRSKHFKYQASPLLSTHVSVDATSAGAPDNSSNLHVCGFLISVSPDVIQNLKL